MNPKLLGAGIAVAVLAAAGGYLAWSSSQKSGQQAALRALLAESTAILRESLEHEQASLKLAHELATALCALRPYVDSRSCLDARPSIAHSYVLYINGRSLEVSPPCAATPGCRSRHRYPHFDCLIMHPLFSWLPRYFACRWCTVTSTSFGRATGRMIAFR